MVSALVLPNSTSHAHQPGIQTMPPSVPPSSPDGSTAITSDAPPPIPYSTHLRHSRVHVFVDSLRSPSYGEDWDRFSGPPPPIPVSTRPPQVHLDRNSNVASAEGLDQNRSNGNPPQQYPHPVSPSAAARWAPLGPVSPSRSRRQARYQYYVVTVGKRTGVFSDW